MDFWSFAMVLGGLGLFLYGMKLMSDGLEAAAGDKLRNGLEKLTQNRFSSVGVGAGVTALIQSSSATSVMVVGFVNAGLMTLTQAVFVGMGANIGTTITAQIVAFNITKVAPLILLIGVLIMMFVKKRSVRRIGEVIGGLGILFFGMNVMSEAMAPLRDYEPFIELLSTFENPGIGLLAGAGVTAIIQSSSATMGILQAFAAQGIIGLDSAVYVILGLNIGTCVTALIASLGGTKTSKRFAFSMLFFNIIGAAIFMLLLRFLPILEWVESWSPGDSMRQLANFHTLFNIVTTCIFIGIPFVLIKMANLIVRGEDKKLEGRKLKFLVPPLPDSPIVAMTLATKEVVRMGRIASESVDSAVKSFLDKDEKLANSVIERDDVVGYLATEITKELTTISGQELSTADSKSVTDLLNAVLNFDRISDIAKTAAELAVTRIDSKIKLSKKAVDELTAMNERVQEALADIQKAIEDKDMALAQRVIEIEDEADMMEVKIKKNHIKRLKKNDCAPAAGTVFTEIVTMMERVADHSASIAKALMEKE